MKPSAQYQAWMEYTLNQNLMAGVDPLVASSWERCLPRLNPYVKPRQKGLSAENLLAAQIANFSLISLARPIMEDLHQFVENSDTVVVVVNSAGYILDLLGDATMKAVARDLQIWTGMQVSEGQIGTNAISIALAERVPARVTGPEHFLEALHVLADAAAPIFDPYGRSLGALGILTLARHYHPHTLGLVVGGARAIEGSWQADLMLQDQNSRTTELDAILAAISEGILVWNAEGTLVHANTVATEILDCAATSLVGRPVSERLRLPPFIREAYQEHRPLSNAEATLTVDTRQVKCVVNLQFVENDLGIQWVILTLRETAEVRKLIQYQVGAQVSVSLDDFVGDSPQIRRLRRLAKTAAPARACALIRGEVGTGKDYLGRALHNASPRRNQPFIIFGCSSVPNELVIGELLGYEEHLSPERTGGRPSKFELAHKGTLFFQDIEALPLEAQAILVNMLELGIVQRLGSTYPIEVDVRVIAASGANLEDQVGQGNFRADLFYRLSPFEIVIPPLRQREGDLPIFVDRILQRLARQHNRPLELAPGVLEFLVAYPWPGNTRELEAVLERATVQAGASPVIGPMHLPDFLRQPQRASPVVRANMPLPTLDAMEREAIIQAARLCDGNVSQMARMLGIGRTTVWRKLKALDISPDHFRNRRS